jgi:hypothetical protein
MDSQDPSSWRRLPRPGEPASQAARARSRNHGIRYVRRLSNWTAAALIAATAATAGSFAHAQPGAQQPASVTGARAPAPGTSTGQPCVTAPVAVSGGSGVTTTVPAHSCAPGTGGGSRPPVASVKQREDQGD